MEKLYIGNLKKYPKVQIIFDENGIGYFTKAFVAENYLEDIREANSDIVEKYKKNLIGNLGQLLENSKESKLKQLLNKIKFMSKKYKNIYKAYICVPDDIECLKDFERPIPDFERQYTKIPGKDCSLEENLPLFKHSIRHMPILVYRTIDGKFKELLTDTSITCIEMIEPLSVMEPIKSKVYMGESEAAFIKYEELEQAKEKDIESYIIIHLYGNSINYLLYSTKVSAEENYKYVMSTLSNNKQQQRKIQQGGGFII